MEFSVEAMAKAGWLLVSSCRDKGGRRYYLMANTKMGSVVEFVVSESGAFETSYVQIGEMTVTPKASLL